MKKPLLVIGGVALLLTVALGGYFFTQNSELEDLTNKKNALEGNLAAAQDKLNSEKEILDANTGALRNAFPIASNTQEEMRIARALVAQTNFLFANSNGSDPKLIVKNPQQGIAIDDLRKEINLLLANWQDEDDILSIDKIDAAERAKIKSDAEKIKNYLDALSKIVAALTPENSGFTQFEIETFAAKLPPPVSIDNVLDSLSTPSINPAPNNSPITPIVPIPLNPETVVTPSSNPPASPPVTVDDVVAQIAVVEQAAAEVKKVEEEITQIENEIDQVSPSPLPAPAPTPAPDPIPVPSPEPVASPNPANPVPPPVSPGIIIQPGKPKLIQGTNPF